MLKQFAATVLVLAATTLAAQAAEFKAFSADAFEAARNAGKGVVVHVHADWCSTCRAQIPILDKVVAGPDFKDVVALRIDFDAQPDARRTVEATKQSTVIVYKGTAEMGRGVGTTQSEALVQIARKAL